MCWAWQESKDKSAKALGPMDVIHALFCTTAFLLVLGMGRGGETPQQDGGNLQFHHELGAKGLTPEPLKSAPGSSPAEWGLAYPSVLAQPASSFGTYFSDTHQFSFTVSAFLCLGNVSRYSGR